MARAKLHKTIWRDDEQPAGTIYFKGADGREVVLPPIEPPEGRAAVLTLVDGLPSWGLLDEGVTVTATGFGMSFGGAFGL